jgi:uncharacterized protein
VTVFNAFGTGFRVWGNRSAAYPAITTPDNFISIRRTMDVIEESIELSMLQFMDQPITNGLITAILASVNAFLRSLIQRERWLRAQHRLIHLRTHRARSRRANWYSIST